MTYEEFEKEFKIEYDCVFSDRKLLNMEQFIKKLDKFPDELKVESFKRIEKLINNEGSLDDPCKTEALVHDQVGNLLVEIVDLINKQDESIGLVVDREKSMVSFEGPSGRCEFVIMKDSIEDEQRRTYLIIIEVKRPQPEDGFVQCLYACKSAFEKNNNKLPVYGLITNFEKWRLIKYDSNGYQLSKSILFFHPSISFEEWMKYRSHLIDYIYSILKITIN